MTYNWNTMVEITVPTGTNGWLYSGEVIINGVKVRFPVGVPTSVPEPAAVLLKKMIELEQEEDANTAKPQNHYVGDVTIPAGKTLTLEKGAKFVDNSGPSEVVILPETEMTPVPGEEGFFSSQNPLSATPTEGATAKVEYNGAEYECSVLAVPEAPFEAYALGNGEMMGIAGGNADAPFLVMLMPSGGEDGSYTTCIAMDEASSVTLSIVQVGAASGGESAGGGVVVATGTIQDDGTIASADKTYAELLAAHNAGKYVLFKATSQFGTTVLPLVMHITSGNEYLAFGVNIDTQKLTVKAGLLYYADGKIEYTYD